MQLLYSWRVADKSKRTIPFFLGQRQLSHGTGQQPVKTTRWNCASRSVCTSCWFLRRIRYLCLAVGGRNTGSMVVVSPIPPLPLLLAITPGNTLANDHHSFKLLSLEDSEDSVPPTEDPDPAHQIPVTSFFAGLEENPSGNTAYSAGCPRHLVLLPHIHNGLQRGPNNQDRNERCEQTHFT